VKKFIGLAAFTASCVFSAHTFATQIKVEELASGLKHPWGMAFLPSGDALITERAGGVRLMSKNGQLSPAISGVPEAAVVGQGGLLGIAVDPDFNSNRHVYICMSVEGEGGRGSEVYKGTLNGASLQNVTQVFEMLPKVDSAHHFGCRIVFDNDGYMFISLGDRGSKKEESQNKDNHIGTVVRLNKDGSVPSDNPFLDGKAPEVFSYGHRNVQGMTLHPQTGEVWTHEHGPKGGDEINILGVGKNYGWPTITYGVNYNGSIITDKTEMDGMEQPLVKYVPSIAPSGMTFYTGDEFPEWKGDVFMGSLKFRHLHHVKMEDGKVVAQNELLTEREDRIRDVVQGPDGALYLLTDAPDGKVLKLTKG
jgi:glucose/arabinose dehydrogenase